MNISRSQRTAASRAQAARLQLSVSRLPTTLRQSLISSRLDNGITARSIWWWSRRHDCAMDEDVEERFLRHQKLMRNRYSKLLQRRSIWEDSESNQSPVWASSRRWLVTRWADKKALSYQRALQAGMQDPARRTNNERPWKEWDRDFDKLKSRIDEEIDRDPYGALFGRYLKGPPSPNNSSWTSFSWIYGPLKSMQRDISRKQPDGPPDPTNITSATSKPDERKIFSVPPRATTGQPSQISSTEPDYEFDPISMRKVLRQQQTSPSQVRPTTPAVTSHPSFKKAFLETFFLEHGVQIPVKTYKPHKVYGYGGAEAATANQGKAEASKQTKNSGIDIENSRLRDIQALKFKTLGNSIDTTAEYGGKYKNPSEPEPIHLTSSKNEPTFQGLGKAPKRHDVKNISGEDESALFTGTTYEAKAKSIAAASVPTPSFKNSWLEKEGFQTLRQALSPSESESKNPAVLTEVESTDQSPKIEPALDRVKASDVKLRNKQEAITRREALISNDKVEDLDLLRASDVRAATRSARTTRYEIQQDKQEARKKLETNYANHQLLGAAKFAMDVESTKIKVSRRLSSVWEHMKQYPQGIVAKTIDGMGIFNNSNNANTSRDKPLQDSTEKRTFQGEVLSKTPPIYKKVIRKPSKPVQTFTPSQEVLDAERAEKARIAFVKQVNEESKNRDSIESKQAGALAAEIRNAYEEQYGKIDVDHRQAASTSPADVTLVSAPQKTDLTEFKKPVAALQPMGPATVKPGVEQDPVIKAHVSVFEPKLAELVDDAKSARKSIHEARLEVMAMRSRRPQTVCRDRSTDTTANITPPPEPIRTETALDRCTQKQPPDSITTPAGPVSAAKYTSEYIILAYDSSTDTVLTSPLDSSTSSAHESERQSGVPQILASLNHTAKFLSHFASLSKQGYEVVTGGGDVLIFKKRSTKVADPPKSPLMTLVKAVIDKNKLAAEDSSAEPVAKVIPVKTAIGSDKVPVKEAATVLDEIPASEPRPGPAGPTAPPMNPPSYIRPKVKRQEVVFSASRTSRVSSPATTSAAKDPQEHGARETPETQEGRWTRFKKGVKRVILTAAAMGVGAYTIGAVAESLGAQHPPERVSRGGRPGIFSTENSR